MEVSLPESQPKPRTAHPQTPQNLLLETAAFQRDEIQLRRTAHRHKSPQPGSHHRTLIHPHALGANSTTKKNRHLENFFLSFKSQFLFPLHTLNFTLAFCGTVDFSFFLLRFFSSFFVILFWFCSFFYCSFPAVAIL